jgi:gliding motility-associated-like protein
VLDNDNSTDATATLTASLVEGPSAAEGTLVLNADGTYTFTPAPGFIGTVEVVYRVCDDNTPANCTEATLYIVVQPGDSDGDGVFDLQEILDGTDPNDPCSFNPESQDLSLASPEWFNLDCDGDGVTNAQEILDGTDPNDPCDFELNSVTLPQAASWNNADCDGDGVKNAQEIIDGTDPLDGCDAIMANSTLPLSQDFLNGDCDGDGLSNGDEIGPDPKKPIDSNGNGIPDYLEFNNHSNSTDNLEIFNLVTPNNDGDNDVFVIRNIELYPENSLEIYNRWGIKVYDVTGYGQNGRYFVGESDGRATIQRSKLLPTGTYFYILKYKTTSGVWKDRKGYLYLTR